MTHRNFGLPLHQIELLQSTADEHDHDVLRIGYPQIDASEGRTVEHARTEDAGSGFHFTDAQFSRCSARLLFYLRLHTLSLICPAPSLFFCSAHPFFMLLSPELRVLKCGHALARVAPQLVGSQLQDVARVSHPALQLPYTAAGFEAEGQHMFVLDLLAGTGLKLQGQMLCIQGPADEAGPMRCPFSGLALPEPQRSATGQLLILCTPRISGLAELER
jgi:hypothetical protein